MFLGAIFGPLITETLFLLARNTIFLFWGEHNAEFVDWLSIFTSVGVGALLVVLGVRRNPNRDFRLTVYVLGIPLIYIPLMGGVLIAYSFFFAIHVLEVGGF